MKPKEMDKLTAHFNQYFDQDSCTILHPIAQNPHIDALLYEPTEKYPFWKMASMGASDYKMPTPKGSLGDRNEYIMMIGPDENMKDLSVANWYYSKLLEIALYPIQNKCFISYGHSLEWPVLAEDETVGAFLDFPQAVENVGVVRCKLSPFKTVVCLQAVLLNQAEIDKLLEIGPQRFSEYIYPEDASKPHFLCERNRSGKC